MDSGQLCYHMDRKPASICLVGVHVRTTCGCTDYVKDYIRTYVTDPLKSVTDYMDHVRTMENTRIMYRPCMNYVCSMYGPQMDVRNYVKDYIRNCTDIRTTYGPCTDLIRTMFGPCTDHVRTIYTDLARTTDLVRFTCFILCL